MVRIDRRGFALAPIVVLALVCITLAFTVTGLSTFQLNASQTASRSEQALYLAEGALQQAMSRLHDGITPPAQPFGRHQEVVTYLPDPGNPQQVGEVSFDPTSTWGWSTNDYDGTQPTGWQNMPVPEGMAMLVARGTVGSTYRIVEAFVTVPSYQYVVAVDGSLNCTGALVASAESSMASLSTDVQNQTPNTILPANVGANGNVAGGSNSQVTGDVVASGTVSLADPSSVGGVVRQAAVAVPHVTVMKFINDYLTAAGASPPQFTPAGSGTTTVQSDCYCFSPSQAVAVPGDLVLDNACLYVNGSITVSGALRGSGAIFVNGEVQVNDGAQLDANNLVALLSTGDVTLQASSAQKYFQGLVYCEGAFTASNITVAGAFVAASNPSESTAHSPVGVSLVNAPVVYVPGVTTITRGTVASGGTGGGTGPGENTILALGGPPQYEGLFIEDTSVQATVEQALSPTDLAWILAGSCAHYTGIQLNFLSFTTLDGTCYIGANYIQYNNGTGQYQLLTPPQIAYFDANRLPITQTTFDALLAHGAAPQMGAMGRIPSAPGGQPDTVNSTALLAAMEAEQLAFMQAMNGAVQTSVFTSSPTTSTTMSLNLNDFLTDQSPLHIVSWRDLPH